jgi:hypothetical protein
MDMNTDIRHSHGHGHGLGQHKDMAMGMGLDKVWTQSWAGDGTNMDKAIGKARA